MRYTETSRHSTIPVSLWLSLTPQPWTIYPSLASVLDILELWRAFHVIQTGLVRRAVCACLVLIAGARWRILRNVNVRRIMWERAAYWRTAEPGGRVPRILRVSLLSRWLSSILLSPLRADANDFVASGIPRPPFPLPRPPLSSLFSRETRLRFRINLSLLDCRRYSDALLWFDTISSNYFDFCFPSPEFNRLEEGDRQMAGN